MCAACEKTMCLLCSVDDLNSSETGGTFLNEHVPSRHRSL